MTATLTRDGRHDADTIEEAPERGLATTRQDEWADLSERDRALLTPEALRRWTAGLTDDDYALVDVARLERQRRQALETLRQGIELTDQEFKLLRYLRKHAGTMRSYLQIARHLWGTPEHPVTPGLLAGHHGYASPMVKHIQVIVSQLRQKLEIDPIRPQHLGTIRAVGYIWYDEPPHRDDGVDYQQRARLAETERFELRRDFGLVFDDEPLPEGARPRLTLGPEHPDYAPPTIEGDVLGGESRRLERE